ncbi:hypothetical protein T03_17084 [Trichinella britovi]|uniref:Uncharacterized protein n=1 Tax=Trichinella britovi TaxID=45882 RepID=A0A0V1D3A4_TRIBR|nr:hypothetical protein T03_17084 [Trichinella britovi]
MFHWQWQCEIKVQVKESAFSAESLGFPRSREEERALCLPKEQGRVCTLPCLREWSFTLQDGAHFWSLHPPPALNISSPISDMFAISQNSFMPDFICLFKTSQFQPISHDNAKNVSYIKIQPSWSRFKGVPDGLLACVLR